LFTRFQYRRATGLMCLDLLTHKPLWQQAYDEGVLSDPILVDSWLYVLTFRSTRGGPVEVLLRRVSPETGQSALSARLVGLQRDDQLLTPGRLTLAGDRLLFRCPGALVCCDLLGELHWVRRLTFVPPDVDRELLTDMRPGDIAVHEGHVIFATPTCPSLECVDLKTGQAVWSCLRPRLRRFVGVVDGVAVLVTDQSIEGIDDATGRSLWQTPNTAAIDAVLPAEQGSILCLTLRRGTKDRNIPPLRRVRWLAAKDGRVVRSELIDNAHDVPGLHDASGLFCTGREIVGLASYDPKQHNVKLFRLRLE